MPELTCAVVGFGGRGNTFAQLLKSPDMFARVVAIADPDPDRRAAAAEMWDLGPDQIYASDQELLAKPRLADLLINTTLDRLHARVAIPAMQKGYHLLLEKPMAATLDDCVAIERTQRETGVVLSVVHSLRYNKIYQAVKKLIDSGAIGEVMSIDQLEGVGDVHFSHSFVRGNWGNEGRSNFMLMTKSCHDVDLFSFLVGQPCTRVSSFGSLRYFRAENAPKGAPQRCLDGCPAAATCPYNCSRIYLEDTFWRFAFPRQDDASTLEYLRTGPYGLCVFQTDNDVVDHQVVSFEYEGGATGTFTMTAFHRGGRYLRVHGTHGFVTANLDERTVTQYSFEERNETTIKVAPGHGGHGGGDALVLADFLAAVRCNDPQMVLTTAQESLASHRIVFAAELARREGRVVQVAELTN